MNISIANNVIKLAKQRQDSHRKYIQRYFPNGAIVVGMDQHETSAEYLSYRQDDKALIDYLSSLVPQDILDIEALMFFGREDFLTFDDSRKYAEDVTPVKEIQDQITAHYISQKLSLADYLESALKRISCET